MKNCLRLILQMEKLFKCSMNIYLQMEYLQLTKYI